MAIVRLIAICCCSLRLEKTAQPSRESWKLQDSKRQVSWLTTGFGWNPQSITFPFFSRTVVSIHACVDHSSGAVADLHRLPYYLAKSWPAPESRRAYHNGSFGLKARLIWKIVWQEGLIIILTIQNYFFCLDDRIIRFAKIGVYLLE